MVKRKRYKRPSGTIANLIVLVTLTVLSYLIYRTFISSPEVNRITTISELPEGFRSHGIDISHYQGRIDWEAFISNTQGKVKFIYCKATEGVSLVDSKWKKNRKNLLYYELRHGAYHFFRPSLKPELQAVHFLDHYTHHEEDLPPVLDVETETTSDDQLIRDMRKWLLKVENEIGVRPVIYTSYHFYSTKFKGKLNEYQFWIANYSDNAERLTDTNIIHWQYSDRGKVAGINKAVDLNYSKLPFE